MFQMQHWRKLLGISTFCLIFYAYTAFGQEVRPVPGVSLRQGEVAPAEGVLFFRESLIALANALGEREQIRAERDNLQAQVGTLKAESEELQKAIKELEEANRKLQLANDKADFMISNFNVILGMYKQALVDVQASRQALIEDNKSLRNDLFWNRILGFIPILGLVGLIIGGF